MRNAISLNIIIYAAIIISFLAIGNAHAGLAISPDRHILELSAGEEKTIEYKVFNSGEDDVYITLDPKYWARTDEEKKIDINSWLIPKEGSFNLKAGGEKILEIKIKAPDSINGELVTMVFFCYKEDPDSALNIRNGYPVYLTIKGTQHYGAQISKVELDYQKTENENEGADMRLAITIQNTGNVHINPNVEVVIKDKNNNEIKRLQAETVKNIFKNRGYRYDLTWANAGLEEGAIYTLEIGLQQDDKLQKLTKTSKFKLQEGKIVMLE
ncbi:MAG: hypothetical protein V2A72_07645 [Candidatus Omnitrophota bacterium]